MPQTSPLNWMILSLMAFLITHLMLSSNKSLKVKMNKKNIIIPQNIWKW